MGLLSRAQGLACSAYGPDTPHVVSASVADALSSAHARRGDAGAAERHAAEALRQRAVVYAAPPHHAELAASHFAMARHARARGQPREAAAHLGHARRVLTTLALAAPEAEQRAAAAASLVQCLAALRAAWKEAGEEGEAEEASAALADARQSLHQAALDHAKPVDARPAAGPPGGDAAPPAPEPGVAGARAARAAVRAELLAAARDKRPVCAALLRDAARRVESSMEEASSPPPAVAAFVGALRDAAACPDDQRSRPLFAATDALREALRAKGSSVED